MRKFGIGLAFAIASGVFAGTVQADPGASISPSDRAPTMTLIGSADQAASTTNVTYGYWRPYWRGYYHGSFGYAPRPNFFFGPVISPRFYSCRTIVYRPVCVAPAPVAHVIPCSGGTAVASAAPGIVNPTVKAKPPVVSPPAEPPLDEARGSTPVVPPQFVPPPSTPEPPLARTPILDRVKSAVTKGNVVGYSAFGEGETARPAVWIAGDKR